MKQLIQNFKSGEMSVQDLPPPALGPGMVLVENSYSLISAGTEKSTVSVGQASLLGKARMRPDLVQQVLANVRREGIAATVSKVRTKLDSLKALGYSTSGTVLASLDSRGRFKPGDRVACGGQDYASHAEIVAVPQNLVAKIPDGVTDEEAAFTTVGAIALQGVRQAGPRLGDNVAVIGLGLVGQLTCQILKANGCNVFGIDVSDRMVELARSVSADTAINRSEPSMAGLAAGFTNGYGFDSVLITAGAASNDPIELAGELLRKKGIVVVVGAVRMDVPRDPNYYRKELEVRLSCSYGPGRYDPEYEGVGVDYPYAYVRYTEQRNMESFLGLVAKGAIDLKSLVTHVFEIDQAVRAYDLILGKTQEPHVGVLLKYPRRGNKSATLVESGVRKDSGGPVIGFLGAGSFAQSYLLPNLGRAGCRLETVVTRTGINAQNVAKKFGFASCSTDIKDVLSNPEINTVFIATQHDTHGDFVVQSLRAGKNVFVEKPLCLTPEELTAIEEERNLHPELRLLVGYNRRFSALAREARRVLGNIGEPLVVNYRVNAGYIPPDHWTQTSAGGGRILGEVCHFVDFAQYVTGSPPVSVSAKSLRADNASLKNDDSISVQIEFQDGSLCQILYVATGAKALEKERVEIFGGGKTFVIPDFREGAEYSHAGVRKVKGAGKGHAEEVAEFLDSVRRPEAPDPIEFSSLVRTSRVTFGILDSLATGLPRDIE